MAASPFTNRLLGESGAKIAKVEKTIRSIQNDDTLKASLVRLIDPIRESFGAKDYTMTNEIAGNLHAVITKMSPGQLKGNLLEDIASLEAELARLCRATKKPLKRVIREGNVPQRDILADMYERQIALYRRESDETEDYYRADYLEDVIATMTVIRNDLIAKSTSRRVRDARAQLELIQKQVAENRRMSNQRDAALQVADARQQAVLQLTGPSKSDTTSNVIPGDFKPEDDDEDEDDGSNQS